MPLGSYTLVSISALRLGNSRDSRTVYPSIWVKADIQPDSIDWTSENMTFRLGSVLGPLASLACGERPPPTDRTRSLQTYDAQFSQRRRIVF